MTPLRDHLLNLYGGFADRRIKDPTLDHAIRVDDRGPGDVYPGFCSITVSVPDRHAQGLILRLGNAPVSPEVGELVEGLGGTVQAFPTGQVLTLPLKSSQGPAIKRLARAIRGVVARGQRYDDANLKWICRRAAASLEQLAEHLKEYRDELGPDDGRDGGCIVDPRSHHFMASPRAPSPAPQRGSTSSSQPTSSPATQR